MCMVIFIHFWLEEHAPQGIHSTSSALTLKPSPPSLCHFVNPAKKAKSSQFKSGNWIGCLMSSILLLCFDPWHAQCCWLSWQNKEGQPCPGGKQLCFPPHFLPNNVNYSIFAPLYVRYLLCSHADTIDNIGFTSHCTSSPVTALN